MRRLLALLMLTMTVGAGAAPALTAEESAALAARPALRVLTDPDRPPYSAVGGSDYRGYFPELMRRIGRELAKPVEFLPVGSWAEAQQRMEAGDADLLLGLSPNPGREKLYRFGESLVNVRSVVYGRPDVVLDDPAQPPRVAMPPKRSESEQARQRFPESRFIDTRDYGTALGLIVANGADITIGNPVVLDYYARQRGYATLRPLQPFSDVDRSIHFVARHADAALLSAVDRAYRAIPPGEVEALREVHLRMAVRAATAPPMPAQAAPATAPEPRYNPWLRTGLPLLLLTGVAGFLTFRIRAWSRAEGSPQLAEAIWRPNVRQLVGSMLLLVGLGVAAMVWLSEHQRGLVRELREAEARRIGSLALAEEMIRASNDLTRMARLFVSTRDPRFRSYYQRILDIIAGRAPRPLNYDNGYWDRVLVNGEAGELVIQRGARTTFALTEAGVARIRDTAP